MHTLMRLLSPSFLLMFLLSTLLNVNFSVLRSMRTTLAVTDLGGSISQIPYFELFGTLPASIFLTWILTRLMSRFPIQRVFCLAMGGFLAFYLLFAFVLYPSVDLLNAHFAGAARLTSMLFFVLAELWKVVLFSLLFWGLLNHYLSLPEARSLYAPLMLGGSVGSILAGPLITACTSQRLTRHFAVPEWQTSLSLLIVAIVLLGLLTMWLFHLLWKRLHHAYPAPTLVIPQRNTLSLLKSLRTFVRSSYLLTLGLIVFVDYVSYSLGEIIFLDVVRERFPEPVLYCRFMGELAYWSGWLTALTALFFAPWVLKRCRWEVAAKVTPYLVLTAAGSFFLVVSLRTWFPASWLGAALALGSLQYCLCRAAKYTFFDASKELAFIPLGPSEKMEGKLVIDGIGARCGRGIGSILSLGLLQRFGGAIASTPVAGSLVVATTLVWLAAVKRLGRKHTVVNSYTPD